MIDEKKKNKGTAKTKLKRQNIVKETHLMLPERLREG